MSIQREGRRIRLPETRTSWEDKSTSEVAAGKLEVMEKFFTPVPHSSRQRPSKSSPKEKSSWEGARNHYYKESISSSSPSSSSSPWSSESNFRVRAQLPGYNSRAPHSRSCIDLSLGKGRANEDKRNFVPNQDALQTKKAVRDTIDIFSPARSRAGSAKKSHLGDSKEVGPSNKSGREEKRILKNGGRRAKSMEALVEKETRKKEGKDKKKGTEEKQRFSRFLDEITIQVLSPSNLNSFGVQERQNSGNRDHWKNSSTDSLGPRGRRSQHNSVAEHQEVRKKGKGKMGSATKAKVNADTPEAWRRRDKSTSPDSVTSSARHRGDREDTNLSASNMGHQPRRISQRLSQEKAGKPLEHIEREKKDGALSGVPKAKSQYTEKAQNSNLTLESATKVPIIPPPDWWGDSGSPAASQHSDKNMESPADQSRRIKDKFPGTQLSSQNQEANLNSSTPNENLEQDKDSLNQKITELLDHLVRAQSTICALEKLNGCDSRSEPKHTGASTSSLPVPSLLPAHRTPQRNHQSRASSSESSGDDPLMSWTDAPSYEPPLDYNSAQKILDTLLGLKNSDPNITKLDIAGGFSCINASKIDGHLIRSENRYSDNPSIGPITDAKYMTYSRVKDTLHTSGQCSQHDNMLCSTHSPLPSPTGDSAHRLHHANSKLPPLPAKRTSVPVSFVNTCPDLSPIGEVGFRPVGKSEGLIHHKSDCLIPTCYLSSPMQFTDPLNQHTDPFVLKSPSGNELAMGNWEGQSHQQDGQRERKPRKDRSVTFSTMNNDGQSKQSQVTARSKFMSSKTADQGQEDSTSMDSTLL